MAALHFRQRRVRRWWMTAITLTVLALLAAVFVTASNADNPSGCDFAATGTTQSCLSPLSGSTFAGGDGNLLTSPTTFGTTDWQNVAGLSHGVDKASGQNDNALGQGSKEDDPGISVVTGSIPNNKSDLTRFYESSETGSNNHNFLYLAWERANVLGTANMDFEINHSTTAGFDQNTTGKVTLNRSAGDLLVTFDFTNGGGRPTIALMRWLVSASSPVVPGFATNTCEASNSFPCWGDKKVLDGTDSIAAVNNLDPVTDPLFPNEGNYQNPVPALQFGETAIDLTTAGVFNSSTCEAFGSTFVRSRSSASFTAEIKDFIAPIPVNITNCGRVIIRKVTVPSPDPTDTTFSYTTTGGLNPATFSLKNGQNRDYGNSVQQGSYSVTETDPGPTFKLTGLSCAASDTSHGSTVTTNLAGGTASFTLKPLDTIDCTYTNTLQRGAIKITKVSSKTAATPLAGGVFSVTGPGGFSTSVTTGSDGTVCVGNLPFGTYSVKETQAPGGYAIDDTTAHDVVVNTNATCGGGSEATFSATDTPLTDITVHAKSQATGGTQSKITCVDSANANIGNSPQGFSDPVDVAANGLKPGTYTCTIVIDP
jgi:Prealbumin-like fold domain